MARPVDERILKLTLDDKDFQNKSNMVSRTLDKMSSWFDAIGRKDISKPSKDLSKINDASKKIKMNHITKDVDALTNASSKLGTVFTGALLSIGARLVDVGQNITQRLFKPLNDGFAEYELKMGSIQTIMSNTEGKHSIQEVTAVLDQLNDYADKTIYSFADMTKNIGTFTASGVDLNKSVSAIKGINNLAAASGSTTQQASTAMYQLSQALASGTVKLQDWNSVVNAGMGGKLFQNALIKTAKEIQGGPIILMKKTAKGMKKINVEAMSFRDSLHHGWLTTEVLIKTLNKFAEDPSMLEAATKIRTFGQLTATIAEGLGSSWSKTWELLIGDFETAPALWTRINNAIDRSVRKSEEWRNAVVKTFIELNGRSRVIESLAKMFKQIGKLIDVVKSSFFKMFPQDMKKNVEGFISVFEKLVGILTPSDELIKEVGGAFDYLFSQIKTLLPYVKQFFGFLGQQLTNIKPILKSVYDIIRDLFKIITTPIFRTIQIIMAGGLSYLTDINQNVIKLFNNLTKLDESGKPNKVTQAFRTLLKVVTDALKITREFIRSFANESGGIVDGMLNLFREGYNAVITFVKNIFQKVNFKDIVAAGVSLMVMKKADGILKGFAGIGKLTSGLGTILNRFDETVDTLANSIEKAAKSFAKLPKAISKNINAKSIRHLAISLALVAGAVWLLSTIPVDKLATAGIAITTLGGVLHTLFTVMNKNINTVKDKDIIKGYSVTSQLVIFSSGLLLLALATAKVGSLPLDRMLGATLAVSTLIAVYANAIKLLNDDKKTPKEGEQKQAKKKLKGFMSFAAGILILAFSIKMISKIDPAQMILSGVVIAGMVGAMSGAMKLMEGVKFDWKTVGSFISFALSITLLVKNMKTIANMSLEGILKATTTLVLLMGAIAGSYFIMAKSEIEPTVVYATSAYISAVTGLINSMNIIAKMDIKQIIKSIATIGVMMGMILFTMRFFKKADFDANDIIPFLAFAGVTIVLIRQLKYISKIPLFDLIKAVSAISILIGMMIGTIYLIQNIKGDIKIKNIYFIMTFAGAIMQMTLSVKMLSGIPIASLVQSVVSVGVLIGMLIGTMMLIENMKVSLKSSYVLMIISSVFQTLAIVLITLSTIQFNRIPMIIAGLALMTGVVLGMVGLMMLMDKAKIVGIDKAAAFALIAGSLVLIGLSLKQLEGMNPAAMATAVLGLSVMILALAGAAVILNSVGIPAMVGLAGILLSVAAVMYTISMAFTAFVTALTVLSSTGIVAFENLGKGIQVLMDNIFIGIVATLSTFAASADVIFNTIFTILFSFIQRLLDHLMVNAPLIIQKLVLIVINSIIILLETLTQKGPELINKLVDLLIALINTISERLPDMISAAVDFIMSFINGLADTIRDKKEEIKNTIRNFLMSIFELIVEIVMDIPSIFLDMGVKLFSAVGKVFGDLPNKIWSFVTDFLPKVLGWFMDIGGNIVSGIIKGIGDIGAAIWNSIKGGFDGLMKSVLGFFGIKSPSRVFMKIGGYLTEGMAIGVEKNSKMVDKSMNNVNKSILNHADGIADDLQDAFNRKYNLTANITPVLEDTNLDPVSLNGYIKNNPTIDSINSRQPVSNISNKTSNDYNINIHATGDLPDSTIRKMAVKIKQAIKDQDDALSLSKGGKVIY